MSKLVADVMTPDVRTVRLTQTAADAARLMRDNDVGSLPVMDDESSPVGVVTDRDLAVRVVAEGRDPSGTQVQEIVSGELVTVEPGTSLDEAEELMAEHKIRRLPVVDDDGRLVGMLAQADVALEESPKKAGKLLEEISEPTSAPRE